MKNKYGVYVINYTVYHLTDDLIMDTEKEYGLHNTKRIIQLKPAKRIRGPRQ